MKEDTTRILIADDDEIALLLTRSALEAGGFEVLVARDGAEAVELFQQARPDCLILDVMMPRLDGYQACARIRATGADAPILIMTSRDDLESVGSAYEAGATDFTSKGISNRLLIERVRFLLREHRARRSLSVSQQRLKIVQDMARIGHWEVDALGRTLHVSALVRLLLTGRQDANIDIAHLVAAADPTDRPALLDAFRGWQATRTPFRLETKLATGNHLYLQGVTTQQGEPGSDATLTLAVQDITALRQAQQYAHTLTNFDALTGLPNRHHFLDSLGRDIRDRKAASPLGVMVFRLRGLERLRKALGQSAYNEALVRSSQVILGALGEDRAEYLTHLGDGEFALRDPACKSPTAATALAGDVAGAFSVPVNGQEWAANLLVGTGIVMWPADGQTAEVLLENASATAARCSTAPESHHEFFAADIQLNQRRLMKLESALCEALDRGELSINYQPRVALDDNRVRGLEALMRWTHPTLGAISPAEFIPIAEETGLIIQLGSWALHEACRQTAAWRRSLGRGLVISVNVSASQLRAPRTLLDDVFAALSASGLPPGALELELTESMIIDATAESLDALQELRRAGVTIALDDFGTGYSSLSYLRRLPIDCLKIDRSFVSDLTIDSGAEAILSAILSVGGALGMRTVAEGIETAEQLDLLRNHGCDEGQGYLFSRALLAAEVEPILAKPLMARGRASAAA